VSCYSVVEKLFYNFKLEQLPFPTGNCPATLYELDVRGLEWPSPSVLLHIANTCPELRVLRMRQPRIWCTLCHTCERVGFEEPRPEKIVYEGGLGLPVSQFPSSLTLRVKHPLVTLFITEALCTGTFFTGTSPHGHSYYSRLWGKNDACRRRRS